MNPGLTQWQPAGNAGARSAYLAMFDEMGEGTDLFKCTNNPPGARVLS
jgi:hypothetical protein